MCFLIFSISLGDLLKTASPSSLYRPMLLPYSGVSFDTRYVFDVTMGSFDGVETCEIVGSYILSKLTPEYGNNIGRNSMADILSSQAPSSLFTSRFSRMLTQISLLFTPLET